MTADGRLREIFSPSCYRDVPTPFCGSESLQTCLLLRSVPERSQPSQRLIKEPGGPGSLGLRYCHQGWAEKVVTAGLGGWAGGEDAQASRAAAGERATAMEAVTWAHGGPPVSYLRS